MLPTFIIVFREIVEAGLVVGIVLAAVRGVRSALAWIAAGVLAGCLGSLLVALFTVRIASAFSGFGQEVFNAAILALAAVMLTMHNIWMARHGRELAANLRQAGAAVSSGQGTLGALAAVVAVAVLREGAEIVLFLFGIAAGGQEDSGLMLLGGLAGLASGAALSWATYRGLAAIPLRHFFSVTAVLLTLLAAGLAGQSAAFLEQAGLVDILQAPAWDLTAVLPETGIPGRLLHILLGYSDQPSEFQLLVYALSLAAILGFGRWFRDGSPRRSTAVA